MPSAAPRVFRSSRAFLVRSADVGEADRLVTFFTEADGVVTVSARSAWRSRKRFGGTLQRYLLLDIGWTETAGRMPTLTSATVLESFWDIVADWERVRHADYILELAAGLFPQPGPKPKAFEALLAVTGSLARGEFPPTSARKSEAVFLSVGGWGPNLSACRRCGKTEAKAFRFVVSEGGLFCRDCLGARGTPLSPGAVKTWRALQAASSSSLGRLRFPDSILFELQSVIPKYLEWSLGNSFRSLGGAPSALKS